MHVLVHREEIGAAGEGEAPRPQRFDVPADISLAEFLKRVRDSGYLESAVGGRTTWLAEGTGPLAVVTQQFLEPWPLAPATTLLVDVAGRLPKPHVFFRHFGQESPEEVYRRYGGDPVRLTKEHWKPTREIDWATAIREFFRPLK